ncbi:MAG: PTS sugar transporter subunit IIA [Olsenella profusa]
MSVKERKVLIITHGHFGIELVKSVEMIMGQQDFIDAMGLVPGQSVDDLRQQAYDVLTKNDEVGAETIVICDLLGGSPSNVALSCLGKSDCKVVLGVNMPFLIELIQDSADIEDTDELIRRALEAGKTGLIFKDRASLQKG